MKTKFIIIIILFLSLLTLTSCVSSEGEKFIEQSETQEQAKKMVEEELLEYGLPIEINGNVFYKHAGKKRLENRIAVDYKTLNKPEFYGRAFVEVDIENNPRTLQKVIDKGIIEEAGYDLYNTALVHVFPLAYESSLKKTKQMNRYFPKLEFVGHSDMENKLKIYVKLKLDKGQFMQKSLLKDLIRDYSKNNFNQPNEEEAKKLIDKYMILAVDPNGGTKILPEINLEYAYSGNFSNKQMDKLLDELLLINGLPYGIYSITVNADGFLEEESKTYNQDAFGNKYPQFVGYLKIDKENKLKSVIKYFQN
ncbi:copper chaperone CopZ [Bacillus pakistanensis]|uniref:Copper chaperone CopZ n=1 Tax=Rossellomorea pakistanensis TaxID=992288 RepID=A0ABS2NDV6_9BACI|nr:hypothetical protein [Bacillus pakistanensis]MBM7586035.1 copper chaperone CopZ [Bacillus pakistanensis]